MGASVCIGNSCKIGILAVIKTWVMIADNTVIAPDAVVVPFSLLAGVSWKHNRRTARVSRRSTGRMYAGIDVGPIPFTDSLNPLNCII